MDLLLVVLGFCCLTGGIAGSVLPVIPGTPLAWIGLLLIYLAPAVPMNYWVLGITFVVMLVVTILEYVIPAKGTKRYGGTKYGIWGTNIGLVLGLIAPIPFGFIIGPFVGAFVGEYVFSKQNHTSAFKAATGSFIGFLASAFIQFVVCVIFLGMFLGVVWDYREILF